MGRVAHLRSLSASETQRLREKEIGGSVPSRCSGLKQIFFFLYYEIIQATVSDIKLIKRKKNNATFKRSSHFVWILWRYRNRSQSWFQGLGKDSRRDVTTWPCFNVVWPPTDRPSAACRFSLSRLSFSPRTHLPLASSCISFVDRYPVTSTTNVYCAIWITVVKKANVINWFWFHHVRKSGSEFKDEIRIFKNEAEKKSVLIWLMYRRVHFIKKGALDIVSRSFRNHTFCHPEWRHTSTPEQ